MPIAYANPAFGLPLLVKIDLVDGYYCIPLSAATTLALAVVIPSDGFQEPALGIPLSLLMGWSVSPPSFAPLQKLVQI
jgi:hypothetical protein